MADITTDIAGWSGTEGSNQPAGTTAVGTGLDDNLRAIQAAVVLALSSKGSDIASATTTDLTATDGLFHDITGTTTIAGFGSVRAGIWKVLQFDGALSITYNATSMILPGDVSITTVAGDVGIFVSEGSGSWRCVAFVGQSIHGKAAKFGGNLVVSGTGPHAIGETTYDYIRMALGGNFTSGGANTQASGWWDFGTITGFAGDIIMNGTRHATVLTTASAQTMTTMAQLWVNEPNITLTGGSTLTNAATVYIFDAPTEGTNNYALWVDSGESRFDGVVSVDDVTDSTSGTTGSIHTDGGIGAAKAIFGRNVAATGTF
ncbi:MAG TPA: hypothetical protein VMW70_10050, partial [Burkholderiales bacterium]|nr:hypothetical protein [Burkholderiales bacterium]